ncbi:MAG TPA: metallophosphoesterase [Candidatus Lokiarchaeia archaeon]|nr:metallophosphoesterase [Candidatus Lokiarchaeia archaeon]
MPLLPRRTIVCLSFLWFLAIGFIGGSCGEKFLAPFSSENSLTSLAGNALPAYTNPQGTPKLTPAAQDITAPVGSYLTGPDYHIFWFLHISDTQNCWYNDTRKGFFTMFLNEVYKTVNPMCIWNTGDLVDSDYSQFMLRNAGQRDDEWWTYRNLLNQNGMNSSVYFDIIGNHDIYRDEGYTHYLNYSMSGSEFHSTEFAVNFTFPWGTYSFLGLPTPNDHGLEYPFADGGFMNKSELDWMESQLVTNQGANLTFTFGHQPPLEIFSMLSTSGNSFLDLMHKYDVAAYLMGHDHENDFQDINGLPALETAQFQKNGGSYRIVAVDNNVISTTTASATENAFPVGVITSPVDQDLAIGSYNAAESLNVQEIRALAWDPTGIAAVDWRADASAIWTPMTHAQGPLWEAIWDSKLTDGNSHAIDVRITNTQGTAKIESITFKSSPPVHFGVYQWEFIIIGVVIGLAGVFPVVKYTRAHRHPEQHQKRPESQVDPAEQKLLLIKLLVLLVAPLSVGLALMNSPTVFFSLFIACGLGIIYSDTMLMFFGVTLLVGLMFPMFFLSRKHARGMLINLFFSLTLLSFLLAFYILHFPTIAWIAPGYYLLIATDIMLARRAVALRKENITR